MDSISVAIRHEIDVVKNVTRICGDDDSIIQMNAALAFCAKAMSCLGVWSTIDEPTLGSGFTPVSFTYAGNTISLSAYASKSVAHIARIGITEGNKIVRLSNETDKKYALLIQGKSLVYFAFGGESAIDLVRPVFFTILETLGVDLTPRVSNEVVLALASQGEH